MNTGIQDAHNLGWKLTAVANGASPALVLIRPDGYIGLIADTGDAAAVADYLAAAG